MYPDCHFLNSCPVILSTVSLHLVIKSEFPEMILVIIVFSGPGCMQIKGCDVRIPRNEMK